MAYDVIVKSPNDDVRTCLCTLPVALVITGSNVIPPFPITSKQRPTKKIMKNYMSNIRRGSMQLLGCSQAL